MALTTDTSTAFPAGGAGYTFNGANVDFSGGTAQIATGVTGWHTVETPVINTTAWGQIYNVAVTLSEALGYYHRFLVSFDGGTTYKRYTAAGWRVAALADIETVGMPVETLEAVYEWPDTDDLNFAIGLYREDSSAQYGSIDLISVSHGTTTTELSLEPDGTDTLAPADPADGLGRYPDFVVARDLSHTFEEMETELGYQIACSTATYQRATYDVTWDARTETEKDDILAFIQAHHDEAFIWFPPQGPEQQDDEDIGHENWESYIVSTDIPRLHGGQGWLTNNKFIASEPSVIMHMTDVYGIECQFIEVFPVPFGWEVIANYAGLKGHDDFDSYATSTDVSHLASGTGWEGRWWHV